MWVDILATYPMTAPMLSDRRLLPLESLRALAAFQVLLLHMFSAFLPAIVFDRPGGPALGLIIHRSALFYFYDGYSAVYIFFVLSGYVLTAPFLRDAAEPVRVLVARLARLAIPALAACILSAAVMALLPDAHVAAGAALDSRWLALNWLPEPGLLAFVRDYFNAFFVGYQEGTVASFGFRPWLPSIENAYVAPLWTIGVEFAGSIVVLALAAIRAQLPRLWLPAVIVAAVVFLRTPYLCFVVGHVAGVAALAERPSRMPAWLCIVGVALGVLLCVAGEEFAVPGIQPVCNIDFPLMLNCELALHFQKRLGALLIFLSLVTWQDARNLLAWPPLARLGRISFPVYLVHWPIVFGPSCVVYLAASAAGAPPLAASLAAILVGIVLTLAVAVPFTKVDAAAQSLARIIRRGRPARSSAPA
ncbi:MAG: acyltransferase [Bauldia sp.]